MQTERIISGLCYAAPLGILIKLINIVLFGTASGEGESARAAVEGHVTHAAHGHGGNQTSRYHFISSAR